MADQRNGRGDFVINMERSRSGEVLGTRINVETYASALERVAAWAQSGKVACVAAANTHLVSEASANPGYAEVLRGFDLVLPDGMPLVWSLRLDGHEIHDRVYGPYFMEHVIRHSPAGLRHYFFGGTEECLAALCEGVKRLNPEVVIAGTMSPPFGKWDEATEAGLIQHINDAQPDFVWVALGGVKQETWIATNRDRFTRGVFLAVGDAFVLLAGLRGYAPDWMQRSGLTWIYRLIQEPRRLIGRYLTNNTRFVVAFLRDRWRKAHG